MSAPELSYKEAYLLARHRRHERRPSQSSIRSQAASEASLTPTATVQAPPPPPPPRVYPSESQRAPMLRPAASRDLSACRDFPSPPHQAPLSPLSRLPLPSAAAPHAHEQRQPPPPSRASVLLRSLARLMLPTPTPKNLMFLCLVVGGCLFAWLINFAVSAVFAVPGQMMASFFPGIFSNTRKEPLLEPNSVACPLPTWSVAFAEFGRLTPFIDSIAAKHQGRFGIDGVVAASITDNSDNVVTLEQYLKGLDVALAQFSRDIQDERRRSRQLWVEIETRFNRDDKVKTGVWTGMAAKLRRSLGLPSEEEKHMQLFVKDVVELMDQAMAARTALENRLRDLSGAAVLSETADKLEQWNAMGKEDEVQIAKRRFTALWKKSVGHPDSESLPSLRMQWEDIVEQTSTTRLVANGIEHVLTTLRRLDEQALGTLLKTINDLKGRAGRTRDQIDEGIEVKILARRVLTMLADLDAATRETLGMFIDGPE